MPSMRALGRMAVPVLAIYLISLAAVGHGQPIDLAPVGSHAQQIDSDRVPHASTCNYCNHCYLEGEALPEGLIRLPAQATSVSSRRRRALKEASSPSRTPSGSTSGSTSSSTAGGTPSSTSAGQSPSSALHVRTLQPIPHHEVFISELAPIQSETVFKASLPNCTACHGCSTRLKSMATESKFLDRTFRNEKGATTNWLFQASTNITATGVAVAKVTCLPIPKRDPQGVLLLPLDVSYLALTLALALGPLFGLIPKDSGPFALAGYDPRGIPHRFPPATILDVIMHKMNKTQVVKAAIFDLLTSQCDRHAQNIFISEEGQIALIDASRRARHCKTQLERDCGWSDSRF
eukprot:gene18467-24958_t